MIVNAPLTSEQVRLSQRNYLIFGAFNGFSYMCLGETIIILVAVQMGMPDPLITILGAMLFLGYLLLPLGVRSAARDGASKCQATFWIYRNIAALFVAISAVLAKFFPVAAWCLLLFAAFLFYGFRAAGVVMIQPLIGGFTTDKDRSKLFGNANFLFYFSGAVALVMVTLLLRCSNSLWVLCSIIVMGASTGIFSSRFINGLYETEMIRQSAREPLFSQWKSIKQNPLIRQILIAGFCRNVALILTGPPSVLMLKKGYSFTDMEAVLFFIAQIIACFVFSWVSGPLIVKKGPRAALIFGLFFCLFVSFLWLISPFSRSVPVYLTAVIAFFFYGIAVAITDTANVCYFLMVTPKEQQIAGSVVLNLFQGVGAGLIGMGIASCLIWISSLIAPYVLEQAGDFVTPGGDKTIVYKVFFVLVIPFYLFTIYQAVRLKTVISGYLEKHGSHGVRKTVEAGRKGNH